MRTACLRFCVLAIAALGPLSVIPVHTVKVIAAAVAFLASDDSAFMTGATLTMNGAQYIAG